jgi:hypothetical protein
MPSLLREIVASALATQSDFEIDANGEGQPDRGFDVLLLCSGGGEGSHMSLGELLRHNPPAIIALDPNGEQAAILRLECHEELLAAPGDLCGVVRQAALGQKGTRH